MLLPSQRGGLLWRIIIASVYGGIIQEAMLTASTLIRPVVQYINRKTEAGMSFVSMRNLVSEYSFSTHRIPRSFWCGVMTIGLVGRCTQLQTSQWFHHLQLTVATELTGQPQERH
jgi:hypothetical protein